MNVIVWQPRSLPSFVAYQKMAERARFEIPEAYETISPHLVSSYQSQSLAEESAVDEAPIKPMGHNSSATRKRAKARKQYE